MDRIYSTAAAGASLDQPIGGKLGLLGQQLDANILSQVSNEQVNWFYSYFLHIPKQDTIDWLNENNIEFLPMIGSDRTWAGRWKKKCWMTGKDENGNEKPKCDLDDMIWSIQNTQDQLNTPIEWLMGFNEPWDPNPNLKWKYTDPWTAAELWGEYFQPLADHFGLKLLSPTTLQKRDKGKAQWYVDFLKSCWELRDSEYACDVTSIKATSIHEYKCFYDLWYEYYDVDSSKWTDENFYKFIIDQLEDPEWEGHDAMDWYTLITETPLWITETNCNYDNPNPKYYPDTVDMCLRSTGQAEDNANGMSYGPGSIKAAWEMDHVHRIAWFLTNAKNNVPVNQAACMLGDDGEWLPIARALFNDLDPELARCTEEPTTRA